MSLTNLRASFRRLDARQLTKDLKVLPGNCNQMTGDGETVTPSLPEPGVWTGMAQANVSASLRWKRAKIHRGSRRRILGPHQEAGYTSAVVTVAPDQVSLLQSGGVHIRPHMTPLGHKEPLSAAMHGPDLLYLPRDVWPWVAL
jgi:hypothetical protein